MDCARGYAPPYVQPRRFRPATIVVAVPAILIVAVHLELEGIATCPLHPYPTDPDRLRAEMGRDLSNTAAFVQLLGPYAGRKPGWAPRGLAAFSHDLALSSGRPILHWRSPDLSPAAVKDPDQQRLLELATVAAVPLEQFKRMVRDRVLRPAPAVTPAPAVADRFVFINAAPEDRDDAYRLAEILCEDMDVGLMSDGGNPAERDEELARYLAESEGIVLLYGRAEPQWLQQQLLRCRKLVAQRSAPPKLLALLNGPPPGKPDPPIRLRTMTQIHAPQGIGPDVADALRTHLR